MVSSTLCPAVHILGSQNVYGRAEGIADHYWPWAVFCIFTVLECSLNCLKEVKSGLGGIVTFPVAILRFKENLIPDQEVKYFTMYKIFQNPLENRK